MIQKKGGKGGVMLRVGPHPHELTEIKQEKMKGRDGKGYIECDEC
jgi:hypothetical protein